MILCIEYTFRDNQESHTQLSERINNLINTMDE